MKRTDKRQWLVGCVLLLSLSTVTITTVFANEFSKKHDRTRQSRQFSAQVSDNNDLGCESTDLIAHVLYQHLSSFSKSMSSSGANGANVAWESNQAKSWYIEQQRYGEQLVIGGLINNDPKAIQAGFKMFDWGFAHQAPDGSFPGTGDPFHSTSFFVEAVAHTLMIIQQSPHSKEHAQKVAQYKPLIHRAALWMISPKVWERGIKNNQPYTHRRYLVGAALGITGKLTGDRQLIEYGKTSIADGLSLQQNDGVNPEKGGFDSSYQMVGVVYAERWMMYFPQDDLTPKVKAMIDRALLWEKTRILPSGKISNEGNTRTGGQEIGRVGKVKNVDYSTVIRGFTYGECVNGDRQRGAIARKIAQYYTH